MLGELCLYAGNIDLHGLNTIHDIEIFSSISRHYGTDFAGVDSWLPIGHNLSHYLLSTAVSAGSISNQLKGSIDVYISTQGGDGNSGSLMNDFTFTIGVSGLQMLLQVVPKIDLEI